MMRTVILAGLAALLVGCGESEDFTMDVAMTPDRVKSQLARVDGGMVVRGLSLTPVAVETGTRRELMIRLKGDAGEGQLHFRFEDVGTNGTRMHVDLSLPAARTTIDGDDKVLSESKAEQALETALQQWADSHAKAGYASLDPLNEIVGGMVLALTPGKMTEVFAAAGDESKLRGMIDPRVMSELEEGGEDSAGDGEPEAGQPMADADAGTADAVQPMNLAEGTEAKGVDPEAFDPTPSQQ